MEIITAYATKNPCYKKAAPLTPKGIVVHSTGANNPNLKRYVDSPASCGLNINRNHWNNEGMNVCVHAFIGYDAKGNVSVANILPYNYKCWGVGSGKNGSFNNSHIQFEICEDGLTDSKYFNKVWKVAVEYAAYLCEKFGLNPMGKNVIVGHYEAHKLGYGSNHADPGHWFSKHGKTMDDFRKAVKAKISSSEGVSTSGDKGIVYKVQVGAFNKISGAQAMKAKLEAAGYDAVIVTEGKAATKTLAVGSSVKVKQGAKTYTGQGLADYVYTRVHKVMTMSGDRVVIGYNGVIVAAVKKADLTVV